ncbi:MAG: MATE family efflux transporter [Planctomycetota bacterium]|jgi:putative MATE family efflux protein
MRLALPLTAGIILHALYSLVDIFWLGKLGEGGEAARAIAAPGVSFPFVWFAISFGMGFGTAGTAIVAQFTGAKRHEEADGAAAQMFIALLSIVVAMATPIFLFTPAILRAFQVPPETIPVAASYARILVAGLPAIVISIGFGSVMRALGDSLTPVLIGVAANAVNMVLDPLLIFGFGPIPAMKASGAATATVISQALSACVCIWLLHHGRAGLHISLRNLRPDWPVLRKITSVGLPTAIGNSSNALGYAAFQVLINMLGEVVISAMTAGFRVIHFLMTPGEALPMAAAPIVGQALGAGKPELAKKVITHSASILAIILLPPTVFLTWQRHRVAAFFVRDPAVAAETAKLFLLLPASLYFFWITMVLMAAFLGSGHTKPAMALHVFRLWCLRVPAALLFTRVFNWGSWGLCAAMVFGNMISAALAVWLFSRGKWQRAVVPAARAAPE